MNKACEGCSHCGEGTNLECAVYGIPPSFYMRVTQCPMNPPKVEAKKAAKVNPLKASKRAKKGN